MNYPIPNASFARIQQAYAQFEQLVAVVAEAMGISTDQPYQIDMQGRRLVIPEAPATESENGVVHDEPVQAVPPPAL